MKNLHLTLVSLGTVLLVAGCGGGGSTTPSGSGIPTGAVKITSANAKPVASAGYSSTSQVQSTGTSKGATVKTATGKASKAADVALATLQRLRGNLLKQVATRSVTSTRTIPPVTTPCDSGNMVESYQDKDNNGGLSIGDVLTTTYNNCVTTATGVTETGSTSMTIDAIASTNASTWSATISMQFSDYQSASTAETLKTNGDMKLVLDFTPTTGYFGITGNTFNTVSSIDGTSQITKYSIIISSNSTGDNLSIGMTTASVDLNGVITLTTTTPFTYDPNISITNYYNGGVMRITGDGGSYVELTAKPDGVHLGVVVDEDGAGTASSPTTLTDITWAEL